MPLSTVPAEQLKAVIGQYRCNQLTMDDDAAALVAISDSMTKHEEFEKAMKMTMQQGTNETDREESQSFSSIMMTPATQATPCVPPDTGAVIRQIEQIIAEEPSTVLKESPVSPPHSISPQSSQAQAPSAYFLVAHATPGSSMKVFVGVAPCFIIGYTTVIVAVPRMRQRTSTDVNNARRSPYVHLLGGTSVLRINEQSLQPFLEILGDDSNNEEVINIIEAFKNDPDDEHFLVGVRRIVQHFVKMHPGSIVLTAAAPDERTREFAKSAGCPFKNASNYTNRLGDLDNSKETAFWDITKQKNIAWLPLDQYAESGMTAVEKCAQEHLNRAKREAEKAHKKTNKRKCQRRGKRNKQQRLDNKDYDKINVDKDLFQKAMENVVIKPLAANNVNFDDIAPQFNKAMKDLVANLINLNKTV